MQVTHVDTTKKKLVVEGSEIFWTCETTFYAIFCQPRNVSSNHLQDGTLTDLNDFNFFLVKKFKLEIHIYHSKTAFKMRSNLKTFITTQIESIASFDFNVN